MSEIGGTETMSAAESGDRSGVMGTRARFETLEVSAPGPGRVGARVVLSWNDVRHEGAGEGEASSVGELRASASATARALGKVVDDPDIFSVVGIKELHVFDHDVVAVLLNCSRLPERRLIGLSIISGDRSRAAALAVLNATNRAVGGLAGNKE